MGTRGVHLTGDIQRLKGNAGNDQRLLTQC